ncbi:MAG: HIT family protein [Candidatus Vogelbacteria bacterium]|nr:HIT family protein [Candidatus Vogelbacteria bacterium]
MTNDCLFCQIINGQISSQRVYEDTDFIAILDIKPISSGHTLLMPKAHYLNLLDLPEDLLAKLGPVLQKLGQEVKLNNQADGLNIAINNGRTAGQIIDHTHIHLIPRFNGDALKLMP